MQQISALVSTNESRNCNNLQFLLSTQHRDSYSLLVLMDSEVNINSTWCEKWIIKKQNKTQEPIISNNPAIKKISHLYFKNWFNARPVAQDDLTHSLVEQSVWILWLAAMAVCTQGTTNTCHIHVLFAASLWWGWGNKFRLGGFILGVWCVIVVSTPHPTSPLPCLDSTVAALGQKSVLILVYLLQTGSNG